MGVFFCHLYDKQAHFTACLLECERFATKMKQIQGEGAECGVLSHRSPQWGGGYGRGQCVLWERRFRRYALSIALSRSSARIRCAHPWGRPADVIGCASFPQGLVVPVGRWLPSWRLGVSDLQVIVEAPGSGSQACTPGRQRWLSAYPVADH